MFACNFQEYTGFGETLGDAWENLRENLRMELGVTEYDEIEPEECVFFKSISVEINREFTIEETGTDW